MRYCDAHIHLAQLSVLPDMSENLFCSASHSVGEWEKNAALQKKHPNHIFTSFGLHPQNPDEKLLPFLENLLGSPQPPDIIGEIGFDLFNEKYKASEKKQEAVWQVCLDLAISYKKPILVHTRKAMHKIFNSVSDLKKIPAVIFHSYPGSFIEAESLLKKGVHAFFSFGKPLLNGHKNALSSAAKLGLDCILLETDAPYQTLKGEKETRPEDIRRVYEKLASLRDIPIAVLARQIEKNFKTLLEIA